MGVSFLTKMTSNATCIILEPKLLLRCGCRPLLCKTTEPYKWTIKDSIKKKKKKKKTRTHTLKLQILIYKLALCCP